MHDPRAKLLKTGVAWLALLVAGCGGKPVEEPAADLEAETAAPTAGASFLPELAPGAMGCGDTGRLDAELYGALSGDIRWEATTMSCEGMPRPDGAGARLRFAGTTEAGQQPLTFIIGIPGLRRATTASELPSNVTMIQDGKGRFFSTPDLDSCWTDITAQSALDDSGERFLIGGRLYCISPLTEVNGDSSVSIRELTFAGQLDWGAR